MKKYLLAFICLLGIQGIYGKQDTPGQKKTVPCKCYCAVKCGPRDMKPGDKLRMVKVKVKGRDGKMHEREACFCAERDEAIYRKHPNKCKITEEVLEQLTCRPDKKKK